MPSSLADLCVNPHRQYLLTQGSEVDSAIAPIKEVLVTSSGSTQIVAAQHGKVCTLLLRKRWSSWACSGWH